MNKPLLYIPIEKLDKSKYIKQLRMIVDWFKTCQGTIIAPTGCGKTIIASIAIAKMIRWYPDKKALVVVPGIDLKEQWEGIMKMFGLSDNVEVIVINSLLLREHVECDLLIADEYHRYPSAEFSKMFTKVKYSYILGLTATIKRLDGLESLLLERAPIVGEITVEEALRKGWISEMLHINVPVFITAAERKLQTELDSQISKGTSMFGRDFKLMQNCQNLESAKAYVAARYNYSNEDMNAKSKQLQVIALDTSRRIRTRKDFLINTRHKIEASVRLIKELDLKTILFSESTQFASEVAQAVGPTAVEYHSNITSREIEVDTFKICKTENAVLKLIEGLSEYQSTPFMEDGKKRWKIAYKTKKALSGAVIKAQNMKSFKTGNASVICTARALDVGFDYDQAEFGLECSRTSAPAQVSQRLGRCRRTYSYSDGSKKVGVYVSLYIPNTQDEKWLRASQVDMQSSVIWKDDIDEAIDLIKATLKARRG